MIFPDYSYHVLSILFFSFFFDILLVMSKWASKRKRNILIVIFSLFFLFFIIFVISLGKKEPTCFDGIQNGTETGVDCGGNCVKACSDEVNNLIVWWVRPFKVSKGLYNVVAYVENQNLNYGIKNLDYEFRLYDENNVLVSQPVKGSTFVEANKRFAIFEPGISTGDREVYNVFFHFSKSKDWIKVPADLRYSFFQTREPVLTKIHTSPRLSVYVKNTSLYDFIDVPVIAILYDKRGNAIASSRTYIDRINHGEEKQVFFSWPEPFSYKIVRIEIIPRINPYHDLEKAPSSTVL